MAPKAKKAKRGAGAASEPQERPAGCLAALSDELLVNILRRVTEATGSYSHALVCKKWAALSREAQVACLVHDSFLYRSWSPYYAARLAKELARFPNLRWLATGLLPRHMSRLKNLRVLRIEANAGRAYPKSLYGLENLRELYIARCLPQSTFRQIIGLTGLEVLLIRDCHMERLPNIIAELPKLWKVTLENNASLRNLPVGSWMSLESLQLFKCHELQFPEDVSGWTKLDELSITWNHNLASLPGSLAALPNLKRVTLESIPNLTSLPSGPWPRLRTLRLLDCPKLVLPEDCSVFSSLEELSITWNPLLASLPDSLAALPGLKQVELRNNRALSSLPSGPWRSLQSLHLVDCPNLQIAGGVLSQLPQLRDTHVQGCPGVSTGKEEPAPEDPEEPAPEDPEEPPGWAVEWWRTIVLTTSHTS